VHLFSFFRGHNSIGGAVDCARPGGVKERNDAKTSRGKKTQKLHALQKKNTREICQARNDLTKKEKEIIQKSGSWGKDWATAMNSPVRNVQKFRLGGSRSPEGRLAWVGVVVRLKRKQQREKGFSRLRVTGCVGPSPEDNQTAKADKLACNSFQ